MSLLNNMPWEQSIGHNESVRSIFYQICWSNFYYDLHFVREFIFLINVLKLRLHWTKITGWKKMLKICSGSTSFVCLDLDLCNPASSQQTIPEQHPVARTASAHGTPHLHWIVPKTAETNWGKDFPLAKSFWSVSENTSILKSHWTAQKTFSDQNQNLPSPKRHPGHS